MRKDKEESHYCTQRTWKIQCAADISLKGQMDVQWSAAAVPVVAGVSNGPFSRSTLQSATIRIAQSNKGDVQFIAVKLDVDPQQTLINYEDYDLLGDPQPHNCHFLKQCEVQCEISFASYP